MIGDNHRAVRLVNPGDITDWWCFTCNRKTAHVFGFFRRQDMTCLVCKPEASEIVNAKHQHLIPAEDKK